jgi:hypothetical protein
LAATRPWGKSLLEQKSSENGHPNLNPEDPEPAEKTGGCWDILIIFIHRYK